ncbi:MAG: Permease [Methanophagales archaeon]|nr:magnesium transporter [Methanophagales archaeon]MCU4139846.1 Permease [Methanophagales archaeon]
MHTISLWELILISVLSGLISASFLLWIAVAISVAGYRRNWNIDNFSSPIITAAGDLVTIPSLYLGGIFLLELREIVGVESSMKIACLFSLIFLAFSLLLTLKNIREHGRRRILIESFPVLLLCGILGIITGSLLEARLERLIAIPAIFVLLPPF